MVMVEVSSTVFLELLESINTVQARHPNLNRVLITMLLFLILSNYHAKAAVAFQDQQNIDLFYEGKTRGMRRRGIR